MRILPIALLLAGAAPMCLHAQTAANTPVTGMQNFIHSVANIEKSAAFYHDVFGLELNGELRPPNGNPMVLGLVSAQGAQFRAAVMKIPGAAFSLELTEFTGIPTHPAKPNHWDPGAADLALRVRDVDAAFAALKKAGAPIISLSGAPVKIGPPAGKIRSVFTRDPDGYILEVIQADPIAADAPTGLVVGANMGLTVGDTEKTLAFYRDLLGMEIKAGAAFGGNPAILDMVGAPGGQVKQSAGTVPGSTARLEFYEFRDVARTPFRLRIPDPGSPALSLRVNDLDALVKRVKAAGIRIITTGGEPVNMGASRNVFVEDPNGVAVELIERARK